MTARIIEEVTVGDTVRLVIEGRVEAVSAIGVTVGDGIASVFVYDEWRGLRQLRRVESDGTS